MTQLDGGALRQYIRHALVAVESDHSLWMRVSCRGIFYAARHALVWLGSHYWRMRAGRTGTSRAGSPARLGPWIDGVVFWRPASGLWRVSLFHRAEIGRASCRERV